MSTDRANAYLRTEVFSAPPERLRLLLLDGAVRFARQAADGLARRDFEASLAGFTQCRAIVTELVDTLRTEVAPDLCATVRGLYLFIYGELVEASLARDAARLAKVIDLLEFERETWALLVERVAAERAGPAPLADDIAGRPAGLALQA